MLVESMANMVLLDRLVKLVYSDFLVLQVSFLVPAEDQVDLVVQADLEHMGREVLMLPKPVM